MQLNCRQISAALSQIKAQKALFDRALAEEKIEEAEALQLDIEKLITEIKDNYDPNQINLRDKIAKEHNYYYVDKFGPRGLTLAYPNKQLRYGYLINKTGKKVCREQIEQAYNLDSVNGRVSIYSTDGSYYLLNDKFEKYPKDGLDEVPSFSEGIACCQVRSGGDFVSFFLDESGRELFGGKRFKQATEFSEGLACVTEFSDGLRHFIDKTGRDPFNKGFKWAEPFADGYAIVRDNGDKVKHYLIDHEGKPINDQKYFVCSRLAPNVYTAEGDNARLVNPFGQDLSKTYDEIFYDVAENAKTLVVRNGVLYGIIDISGKEIITPQYQWASEFSADGTALVIKDNKYFFIDRENNNILNKTCDNAENFKDGLAPVEIKGMWHVIDIHGNILTHISSIDDISIEDGMLIARLGPGESILMDKTGKTINNKSYQFINYLLDGVFKVEEYNEDTGFDEEYYIDKTGRRIFEHNGDDNE